MTFSDFAGSKKNNIVEWNDFNKNFKWMWNKILKKYLKKNQNKKKVGHSN